MVWVLLSIFVLFVGLGVIMYLGKGSFLIAGYNTMPKEDQEKFDTQSLGKFMGKSMFALSAVIGLWVFAGYYELDWLFYVGTGIMFVIVIFMVVYANTGNRFMRK